VNAVVIDSSVLGAWMIDDEPAHEAAVRFIAGVADGAIEPVLAEHCRFEVRHALVRAARRGRVAWVDLPRWFDALDALEATIAPLAEQDEPVLALAERLQLTWSDAHWVEIAARLDLPLLTADLRLIRSVPNDVAILVDVHDAAA
jgi:predicted nucleic acid-binding protein